MVITGKCGVIITILLAVLMMNVLIKKAVNLTTGILLMVKIVGNEKPSLLIVPLLAALQSFPVGVKEKLSNEINDESCFPPPGIGFSFAMCHTPLYKQADGFQLLVDSGSSKYSIDPKLMRGVASIMFEYTRIEPLMEKRAAGDTFLLGIGQVNLLVVVCGTDNVLRTVKLPIVLGPR